ncbi:MAG: amidohydrolase family protein [Bacteroidota bacterium]
MTRFSPLFGCFIFFFSSCQQATQHFEILLKDAQIIDGTGEKAYLASLGINADTIAWIGKSSKGLSADQEVDAQGFTLSPGFIDPHTHTLRDLQSSTRNGNENYLQQGVTTVVCGNDGGGSYEVARILSELDSQGIGTNTALFVGHRPIRRAILGMQQRPPDAEELQNMQSLVRKGMEEGALGFSSGLFYTPSSFAKTEEVIELAKVAGEFGGLYDVHIRDESSYNIGLLAAIKETIDISRAAQIHANISHIKALGVEVWGLSEAVIELVEQAQAEGLLITADQYPFEASSTSLSAALVPRWVFADIDDYRERFDNLELLPRIKEEMAENLRRRGGPEAVLLIAAVDSSLNGKNLKTIADLRQVSAVEAAIQVLKDGGSAIASFNMQESDIKNFMKQPWVMTSSDGGSPHPRKYASFSKKINYFVLQENVLPLETMIYRSSGMTARVFGIPKRGLLKVGYFADMLLFKPEEIKDHATFIEPAQLSTGIYHAWVNGQQVIEAGTYNGKLAGRSIYRD